MKAALLYGPRDVRVVDVPKPAINPGEVLVKIKICMTSGTTAKKYERRVNFYPGWGYPHGFGYEWAGEVTEVGEGVDSSLISKKCITKIGEGLDSSLISKKCVTKIKKHSNTVVPRACSCFFCIRGQTHLCNRAGHALDKIRLDIDDPKTGRVSGYFKEYTTLPASMIYVLPKDLSIEDACQIPYVAYAVHGINNVDIKYGDVVAVIGAGAMGMIQMMLAHLKGALTVAIDKIQSRLDFAKKIGVADFTINASNAQEAKKKIKKLSINEGQGPDVVIEAVGLPQTYKEAVELVRRGGQVLMFGGAPEGTSVTLDTYRLHYDEIKIIGSVSLTTTDSMRASRLVESGKIKPSVFITGRYPLTEITEALELYRTGKGIKYAIIP